MGGQRRLNATSTRGRPPDICLPRRLAVMSAAQFKCLMPGRVSARTNGRHPHVEDIRFTAGDHFRAAPQRLFHIVRFVHRHPINTLRFRQHDKIDLGVTEEDLRVFILFGEFPARGVEVGAHRLIIEVIPEWR